MQISVLIPAFKPAHLTQAIGSVLAQGFTDYELLINDDSLGEDVRAIVDRFSDPRIRYTRTSGGQGSVENCRQLWEAASCDLVKFLFDDDILLPNAMLDLKDLIDANPRASFAFGHRDFIDDAGRIVREPRLINPGKTVTFDAAQCAAMLLPTCANRVGEFSNVLMNRAVGVNLDDMFAYRGVVLEMLADVAFYLNAARRGPGVGLGRTVAHYRKHANQSSTIGYNPNFFKGILEWELFARGEFTAGGLSEAQFLEAIDKLHKAYAAWGKDLPELHLLRDAHEDLKAAVRAGQKDLLDTEFFRLWDAATAAAKTRTAGESYTVTG